MDYVGQKCRALVPIRRNASRDIRARAEATAGEALEAKCRAVGLIAMDMVLISCTPWDEAPELDVLCFEATAAR